VPQVRTILSSINDRQVPRNPNDAKLFLISISKAIESLETFRSGLVGLSLKQDKPEPLGDFRRLAERLTLKRAKM
jgi:hypothetical protein